MLCRLACCLGLNLLYLFVGICLFAQHWRVMLWRNWHHGGLRYHALIDHAHDLLLRDVAGQRALNLEEIRIELVIIFASGRRHLCCLGVPEPLFLAFEKVVLALVTFFAPTGLRDKRIMAELSLLLDGVHDLWIAGHGRLHRISFSLILRSILEVVVLEHLLIS